MKESPLKVVVKVQSPPRGASMTMRVGTWLTAARLSLEQRIRASTCALSVTDDSRKMEAAEARASLRQGYGKGRISTGRALSGVERAMTQGRNV